MPKPVCDSMDYCPCERCNENDAVGMFWYINSYEYFGCTKKLLINLCDDCALLYQDFIIDEEEEEEKVEAEEEEEGEK